MDIGLGLTSLIIGVGLHVVFFRQAEWHLWALKFKFGPFIYHFCAYDSRGPFCLPIEQTVANGEKCCPLSGGPCLRRAL